MITLHRNDDITIFSPFVQTLLVFLNESGTKRWSGSCFQITVGNTSWLITAGHIIRDLLNDLADTENELSLKIADAWIGPKGHSLPVNLPVHPQEWVKLGDGKTGRDLGAIKLSLNIVSQLKAGRTVFFPEKDWRKLPKKFDVYRMLGAPGEMIETKSSQGALSAMGIKRGLFTVRKIRKPSPKQTDAELAPWVRFYAKVSEHEEEEKREGGITIKSPEGCSGGPILGGVHVKNGTRYWPIAVQSGYLDISKVITGEYLVHLGNALAKLS